jgi:outer membrane protein OmpA-like peptidoglycan-associated protein
MNIRKPHLAIASAVAVAIAACTTQPTRYDELERARTAVQQVESSPDAGRYAAAEVSAAHEALLQADRLVDKKKPAKEISEAAYLAQRHADIAAERIASGLAEARTAAAEAERQKVLLQAREQEASAARAQAEMARAEAERARTQADAARSQAEIAKEQAERANEQARLAALDEHRRATELEEQLRKLQAKQTERGMVLTLGDVLFDTGKAELKPGAASTLERLSTFLSEATDRMVTIEGHTDSMGADSTNRALSENRANAVKSALVAKGIAAERIVAVGKGEEAPVASNDTAAGRQQNRRVEIIVSNASATPKIAGQH